jgi:outer membrane receptor protein involved in Fe transport
LRGGSGSIYANNSPGGLINFISKEGTNDFKGSAKLETSTYGLMRTDVNVGGALVKDKLFFNIGGFTDLMTESEKQVLKPIMAARSE